MDITRPCKAIGELNKYVQVMLLYALCRMDRIKMLPPIIVETYRGQERQNYLYCQGRSVLECVKKGIPREFASKYCNLKASKVTWTLNSKHKKRCAVDLVPSTIKGGCNWNGGSPSFTALIKYMILAGFTAGALWEQEDYPHFQLEWDGKPFGKNNTPSAVTRLIQRRLNANLHIELAEDGDWGGKTTSAVKEFNKQCRVLVGKDKLALKAFTKLLAME